MDDKKYLIVWYNHREYYDEATSFDSAGELTEFMVRKGIKKNNIRFIFCGDDVTDVFDTANTR